MLNYQRVSAISPIFIGFPPCLLEKYLRCTDPCRSCPAWDVSPLGENRRVTGSFSVWNMRSQARNTGFHIRCSWVKNIMDSCLSFWNVCTVTQDHLLQVNSDRCCGTMLQSVTTLLTKTYFWEAFGMVWYYDIVNLFFFHGLLSPTADMCQGT